MDKLCLCVYFRFLLGARLSMMGRCWFVSIAFLVRHIVVKAQVPSPMFFLDDIELIQNTVYFGSGMEHYAMFGEYAWTTPGFVVVCCDMLWITI